MVVKMLKSSSGRLLAAGLLLCSGVSARAGSVDVQYAVSLAGLTLGTATLSGSISPTRYSLNAQAHLTGLAGMVTGGKGAAAATGQFAAGQVVPGNYSLTASNSEITRTVQMGLTSGNVDKVVVNPPLDPRPDRVPVTGSHQRGVLDPLGAALLSSPAKTPESACNRTLPVFDGAQRFDIQLSYAGTRNAAAKDGYSGPVVVCKARYTPIAGHRAERAAVKYMANNRDMEAWLAPSGIEGVYLPFRVSIKTMIGTTVIQAVKYHIEPSETTAGLRR
ncbi:MAG TPA: DUF3108 domain-containing protein [Beijerinckiaceae bacterium]|mgnify:CR=1 FL=1|nr:DUF3108 domain-containing protein [Beijerinckiaceae bacterium]